MSLLQSPPPVEPRPPRKWLRLALAAGVGAACALAATSAYTWQQMRSDDCIVEAHDRLSMDELISVKRRLQAYREDPSSHLSLSDAELSMLLAHRIEMPVRIDIDGDQLAAQIMVPTHDQKCYPVHFDGHVEVEKGEAVLLADSIQIGSLDLSWLLQEVRLTIRPEHLSGEASKLLTMTRDMEVRSGQAYMQVSPHALKLR